MDTEWTAKKRFIAALERRKPDRLPVTTHHVMPYFLEKYMDGIPYQKFFDHFGLDPINWVVAQRPNQDIGEYFDPTQKELGFLEPQRICSDNWRIRPEIVSDPDYKTIRYNIDTPKKTLSMTLQSNDYTTWVSKRLIEQKSDIDILAKYGTMSLCDVEKVNTEVENFGERGLVRGFIPGFEIYGQSGCWQDAAVLYGVEQLIMETFYDPQWVHAFMKILQERKRTYLLSMEGARFDVIEHGGGDASSTVISPEILETFVLPYDAELTNLAHQMGQRVVYHTCGGMMPFLEMIAATKPDAMETFTPASMGGDINLKEAKRRIGHQVCMIGGFDQFHYFQDCSPDETKKAVQQCFEDAGEGGGFILAPSDHFFDADTQLIAAFADEAKKCLY
jgi:uroporphyrinogen decarboxylase